MLERLATNKHWLLKHSYIRAVKSFITLGSGFPEFSPISVSVITPKAGNTKWRGRTSTIDLLIRIACFVAHDTWYTWYMIVSI